jgi:hypothetical protein
MRAEQLHAKLMREAARDEERSWYQERLELVKDVHPEAKSDQYRRQLWDLRAKTNSINIELDLRRCVEQEGQRHLKATMALREANMTVAEKQARAEDTRRRQILFSRIVSENSPDWRQQENLNAEIYRQQISPGRKSKC